MSADNCAVCCRDSHSYIELQQTTKLLHHELYDADHEGDGDDEDDDDEGIGDVCLFTPKILGKS